MSYSEELAARVRKVLAARDQVVERKMFGGLCFMVGGAMCCGILGPDLIVRVGAEQYAEALAQRGARPFDFTGRPSRGMVYVGPAGTEGGAALARWVRRGLAYVEASPPRRRRARRPRPRPRARAASR